VNDYGFFKVAAAVPVLKVANPDFNKEEIKKCITLAAAEGAGLVVFPELSLTGYTCADLFFQEELISASQKALTDILKHTVAFDTAVVVGMPIRCGYKLYNCAVVLNKGKIMGAVPKEYLPDFDGLSEKRWFASGVDALECEVDICGCAVPFGKLLFKLGNDAVAGIEIGQDACAAVTPGSIMAVSGANLILNPSAFADVVEKNDYTEKLLSVNSASCVCGYVHSGAGVTESTTDLVFSGEALVYENGALLARGKRFSRRSELTFACIDIQRLNRYRAVNSGFSDNSIRFSEDYRIIDCKVERFSPVDFDRFVDPTPFVPSDLSLREKRCEEIFNIQTAGLAKRLEHTGLKKLVIGISGGLDSTLALLVAAKTMELLGLPMLNIIGITMPGFGTTGRTYNNALELISSIGASMREISIGDAVLGHFRDIGHDPEVRDVTYENAQARERTQILMDVANSEGAILVGTGDLSEAAMGWCTYNGDHMSMYGVNAGIPKTLVKYLVSYVSTQCDAHTSVVLKDILDTPVSPELLPPDENGKIVQKTEDKIGPYELHDFFLYHFVRAGASKEKILFLASKAFEGKYDRNTIDRWLTLFIKRFFASQFKRTCTPDAPKIGSVGLSPRGDWKMPTDADCAAWLD